MVLCDKSAKLQNFGNIFFQFRILIISNLPSIQDFEEWIYINDAANRHSLIALIALLRLARISNLIVGHTGIWGSRDQLSIVFALRNESKIFFGHSRKLKKILRCAGRSILHRRAVLGRKTMQNDARLLRLLS